MSNDAFFRRRATALVAIIIVIVLYQVNQVSGLSESETRELASHFNFKAVKLPELTGYRQKSTRAVNRSLERLSAWVSSVGAAVALNDLDADGLANDLCYVDPRIDEVIVAPAASSPPRYAPFALSAWQAQQQGASVAPMGCLPGDYNEDGLMDILVYYWGRTPLIFLQKEASGGGGGGTGHGLSRESYEVVELVSGEERWYTNAATLADLDGDGHTDIIIGNYFQDGARILDANTDVPAQMHDAKAKSFNGGRNRLLRWITATGGDHPGVRFEDVKGVLDDEVARGWTLAVGAADLDGDLLPEIYFANDFGPDRLLYNLSSPGNLRFKLLEGKRGLWTPASCVLGSDSFKGMGVDFADVNGDGYPDIYVSNITSPFGLQESHFLWLSTGETGLMKQGIAPYRQASEELGLSRSGWGWDCRLDDFNNDGVLEAIQAVGFIKGKVNRWPELQSLGTANSQMMQDTRFWPGFRLGDDLSGDESNAFFAVGSDGQYHNIGSLVGFTTPTVSRGIAIADVDGDGRLDFAIANQWGPSYFYHNESENVGAFLGLHVMYALQASGLEIMPGHPVPSTRGRPAIGATVRVHLPQGKLLSAQVDGGSGHSGKRSPELHFGLGKLAPDSRLQVDIKWRTLAGGIQQKTVYLAPGWHTILLN